MKSRDCDSENKTLNGFFHFSAIFRKCLPMLATINRSKVLNLNNFQIFELHTKHFGTKSRFKVTNSVFETHQIFLKKHFFVS